MSCVTSLPKLAYLVEEVLSFEMSGVTSNEEKVMLLHVGAWAFCPQSLLSMESPLVAAAYSIQGSEVGCVRYTYLWCNGNK